MKNEVLACDVRDTLSQFRNPQKAEILSRFFKTGKGQYGEGDVMWGIPVPQTRLVVKETGAIALSEIAHLIDDPVHEVRLCGFLLLVHHYAKAKKEEQKKEIVDFYLANARKANNWDLVDLSAPKILGLWLRDKDKTILYRLADSDCLWEQRIALVSNWTLIRVGQYEDLLNLCTKLIDHPHDLIRKALGWMLREVGKKDERLLTAYLDEYALRLSRTSLRYAIERLSADKRSYYLSLK